MLTVDDVVIYDLVPGFKYKAKFINLVSLSEFMVLVEEDVPYNKAFNKDCAFSFDAFRDYLLGTNIPDAMKNTTPGTYILTFIVFNQDILKGTGIENFGEGMFCVDVDADGQSLIPELFESFCEQYNIPHVKSLYKGQRTADQESVKGLLNNSRVSLDGKCWGLSHRGAYENVSERQLANDTHFEGGPSNTQEADRLLEEFVKGKAHSEFIRQALHDYGGTLSNATRAYNSITNAILSDFEFQSYHELIRTFESEEWIKKNMRSMVKQFFKPIIDQMKPGQ